VPMRFFVGIVIYYEESGNCSLWLAFPRNPKHHLRHDFVRMLYVIAYTSLNHIWTSNKTPNPLVTVHPSYSGDLDRILHFCPTPLPSYPTSSPPKSSPKPPSTAR
jgi:hypothetical protein